MDGQLPGARFLPNPVPAPGTEAQGLSKRSMADVQHRLAMFNIPKSRQRLPCIYCQKQLALPPMADYFMQVISFQFWAGTKFAHGNKLYDIFFGHLVGSLCHRVCVCSCESTGPRFISLSIHQYHYDNCDISISLLRCNISARMRTCVCISASVC